MKKVLKQFGILLVILVLIRRPLVSEAVTTVIRVGYNNGFPNYQYAEKGKDPTGLHIDILNRIGDIYNLNIEYVPYQNDSQCIEALSIGEIDVILGINEAILSGSEYIKTSEISRTSLCLLASNEEADNITKKGSTAGMLCAVERRYLSQIISLQGSRNKLGFGKNTFLVKDNQKEAISYLINEKVNIAICERNSAISILEEYGVSDDYTIVYNYLVETEAVMAMRSTDNILCNTINMGIAQLRSSGEYETLYKKWIDVEKPLFTKEMIQRIGIGLVVILGIIIVYVYTNLRIRKALEITVQERTKELQIANEALAHNMCILKKEGELRKHIIEDSPSGMLILGEDDSIQFMNSKAIRIFGISDVVDTKRKIQDIPLLHELIRKVSSEKCNDYGSAIINTGSGEKERIYRCSTYMISSQENGAAKLCSVEDVTSEEKQKKEIFEAEKNSYLNTIIAGLAHEIKNPLTAIKAYTELIPEQMVDEEFLRAFFETVPKETERINGLIESLINYARPIRGIMAEVELSQLIFDCVALVSPIAKRTGVTIKFIYDSPITIYAYVDQLRQAIINYLMNSIESLTVKKRETTSEDLGVEVRLYKAEKGDRIIISIFDNGIGMTKTNIKRCMEPFFTTKAKGTGMGMAIALQGINESGGNVTVDSKKDHYTRIQIEFNLSGEEKPQEELKNEK